MPSIFTTPRTGPDCSTVTCFTSLRYFSRPGESSGVVAGPFCRMHTSWLAPAIGFPPKFIEPMMLEPLRGIAHCSAPVSTVTDLLSDLTLRMPAAVEAASVESETGPWDPAGMTVANPLHLMEPSGQ